MATSSISSDEVQPHVRTRVIISEIVNCLESYRFTVSTELALQESISQVLAKHKYSFVREFRLSRGPVDFYVPEHRIAIEAKIKGSPSSVAKQVLDYIDDEMVDGLILVSRKLSHINLPENAMSKPLATVWVGGAL